MEIPEPKLEEYAGTTTAELWVCDDETEENFENYIDWLGSICVLVLQ